MRILTRRAFITSTAMLLAVSPLLSACGSSQAADEPQDMPVDVLIRGAEPGGMTSEWESQDGSVHASLGDDGKAFYKVNGDETSGTWLMSSPTEGDLILADGKSLRLTLDTETDTLQVIDVSGGDGSEKVEATLARCPGEDG